MGRFQCQLFRNMNRLIFYIPFSYFVYTRLNNLKAWVFHSYYEWLPALFILIIFSKNTFQQNLFYFALAYLAFISIYEVGYFINDFYASRKEKKPRERLQDVKVGLSDIIFFYGIRFLFFFVITWHLDFFYDQLWQSFYLILAIVIVVHNLIKENELKSITFLSMAMLRLFAPIIFFINNDYFGVLTASFFVNYVFFRLITYMDSKDLLTFKRTERFKMNFYLMLLPLNLWMSAVFQNFIPFAVGLYYLIFTAMNYTFNRN